MTAFPVLLPRTPRTGLLLVTLALLLASPGIAATPSPTPLMHVVRAAPDSPIDIFEGDHPVLRYQYFTVEPGPLTNQVSEPNRIYARARSDYIHPLYGLDGEVLTRDWPLDHPHHRGIYWAWPEVDYGTQRGDLHALQRVFARPTGTVRTRDGDDHARVESESLWLWENQEPIVRETALIIARCATGDGRTIDLAFRFEALKTGLSLARRGTTAYGGLNLRLATPASQSITVHTDPPAAHPLRTWSDLSGVFTGSNPSGLTVLQSPLNPDYPGDWIQYPELSWCQPAFPRSGTRYALTPGRPLTLRFRLWIHRGGSPAEAVVIPLWDALTDPAQFPPPFSIPPQSPNSP